MTSIATSPRSPTKLGLLFLVSALAGCANREAIPVAQVPTLAPPVEAPAIVEKAPEVDLPLLDHATDVERPPDAVEVSLVGEEVRIEGTKVDDVREVVAQGRPVRLDGLFNALKALREQWKVAHPESPLPGAVMLALGRDTKASIVKSIFQTAAFSGYPNAYFLVRTPQGIGALPVDAVVFRPPEGNVLGSGSSGSGIKIRTGATTVKGGLAPELVHRIIRQNFGRFALCYRAALAHRPDLRGTVTTELVIGPKGDVTSTKDRGSTLQNDDGATACIVRGFANLSFPPPTGGGSVTVVYPLELSPGD